MVKLQERTKERYNNLRRMLWSSMALFLSWPGGEEVNPESAILANEIANLVLKIETTEKGDVDMCQAMVEQRREDAVIAAARMARRFVKDELSIIESVANEFSETTAYVKGVLEKYKATEKKED